ncbi:FAD-dependent monooxygenase [Kribbella koreensis]|uniref:FAD-dependent monooxygenase n=1 Tax=Kribbella koreensis TaxID=57909 RepID=A0ABN1RKC5_9ACTN
MAFDFDVVVVGAGPVGSLLTAELALQGVRVGLLEALAAPTGRSKAGTLHARTAQVLERRGLLDLVAVNQSGAGPVPFHFAGMFDLDLAEVVDEGPAIVGSPQAYAERVFAEQAVIRGAEVLRGEEVLDVTDHGDHVSVQTAEGRFTARYVVGCDGPRSAVRKSAGIPFTGTEATVAAMMGEVRLLDPYNAPQGWQRNARGWTMVSASAAGPSRIFAYDFRGPHENRDEPLTLQEFSQTVDYLASRHVPMTDGGWLARFGDAALQAEQYRKGNVFVAGDAAHVHFPAGGQGVNLGLQDALNLGWKLAAAVHGWAPDGLLDTYHSERHPIGARVLWNVRAQVALMQPDPRVDWLRDLFRELMGLDQVNEYLGRMISGMDVAYDVGLPDAPLAGELAPDLRLKTSDGITSVARLQHEGKAFLLDLAGRSDLQAVAAGRSDRLTVLTANASSWVGTDALLVRPDGYVAWSARGRDDDPITLDRAIARWFGLLEI